MAALPPLRPMPGPPLGGQGWYPDPWQTGALRWWDGATWTSHWASRPGDRVRAKHPTLPLSAAVGAVLVLLVSLVVSRFVLDGLARFDWPIVVYVAITGLIGYGPSVWWCMHASRRYGSGSLVVDAGVRWRWIDLAWGPLIWLSALVAEAGAAILVAALHIPITSNVESVDDAPGGRGYVIALLVLAVIAAPIVEELVFRGIVMRGLLSRMGAIPAIAIQGVLFGAAHFDPVRGWGNLGLVIVLSTVGIVFGGGAYLLRRITPTMVAHGIFNLFVLVIVLTGLVDPASGLIVR